MLMKVGCLMNIKAIASIRGIIVVFLTLLWVVSYSFMAQAAPLPQDPRPPVNPGGGGGTAGGGDNGGGGNKNIDNTDNGATCASINGQVINWGFGPQSDIGVKLTTGSWQASATSSSDGSYGIGGLGVGIATLAVAGMPGELQPLAQNAGIYLNCDYPIIANLALFSGSSVTPPAYLEISAPDQVIAAGDTVKLTLTLKNTLPNDISNVIVTDMMPAGLTAQEITSSPEAASARIVDGGADGQLAVVYFDKLAAGAKASIQLVVKVKEGLSSGTQITNGATLFYRESAADQTWIDLTVGKSGGAAPAVAASPTPVVEASPTPVAAEATPTPLALPTTEAAAPTPQPTAEAVVVVSADNPTATPVVDMASEFTPPMDLPVTGTKPGTANQVGSTAETGMPLTSLGAINYSNAPSQNMANTPSSLNLPLTVVLGALFLGGLAFGSGLKFVRRSNVWAEDED